MAPVTRAVFEGWPIAVFCFLENASDGRTCADELTHASARIWLCHERLEVVMMVVVVMVVVMVVRFGFSGAHVMWGAIDAPAS